MKTSAIITALALVAAVQARPVQEMHTNIVTMPLERNPYYRPNAARDIHKTALKFGKYGINIKSGSTPLVDVREIDFSLTLQSCYGLTCFLHDRKGTI